MELISKFTESIKDLPTRMRLKEDIYLAPNTLYHFGRLAYLTKKKRTHLWFDLEPVFQNNKDKIALVFPRALPNKSFAKDGEDSFRVERYTYGDLYSIVLRLSYILVHECNVEPKDIVAIDFPNSPLFVFLFLAIWNVGAVPAMLNYNLVNEPLTHCIDVVKASKVIVDELELGDRVRPTLINGTKNVSKEDIVYFDENEIMQRLTDPNHPIFKAPEEYKIVEYFDPAVILFTSGTTGLPKGAVNSWKKIYFATHIFPHAMRINQSSSIYTAMPLYHGTAAVLGMLPALTVGGTICIGAKFSVSSYWTQVKLCEANTIQYVGEVCRYLVGSDKIQPNERNHKVKIAYGNGLRADIWVEFKRRFGIESIGEFYSSSEAPFATTCFQTGDNQAVGAIRNCGFLAGVFLSLQYCLVKLDPEDESTIYRDPKTGFCCQPKAGEKGEMVMKVFNPKNVKTSFPGYINNDKATYSKVIHDVFRKGDAYIRSDDIMRYDDKGYLYFVDRLGDTYRWKSENVSTSEVENQVMSSKLVDLCIVVGARVDNHEGRAGYAYIKPHAGLQFSDILSEEKSDFFSQLAKHVTANLPHYARPVFLKFKYDLHLTENHKMSKKPLRDPVLPGEGVYYFDQKNLTYKYLDEANYNKIRRGEIRL